MVLVTVVALAVLLCPPCVRVLLRPLGRLVLPALRRLAILDPRVVVTAVALLGDRYDRRVDDLAAHRQVALLLQIAVEVLEQRLDHARSRQLFPVEPHRLGVGDLVLKTEPYEPHEREAVAKLVLHLVVREIVKLAENDRLEHRHRVPGLSPRRRLPFLRPACARSPPGGHGNSPTEPPRRSSPKDRSWRPGRHTDSRCRKSPFGPWSVPHIYAPNRPDYNRSRLGTGIFRGALKTFDCDQFASRLFPRIPPDRRIYTQRGAHVPMGTARTGNSKFLEFQRNHLAVVSRPRRRRRTFAPAGDKPRNQLLQFGLALEMHGFSAEL